MSSNETMAKQCGRSGSHNQSEDVLKFLTFCLDGEEYGLPILSVREIIGVIAVTPVPRQPAYVKGVINLRGKIIPVVDMRVKCGMARVETTSESCIIVVDVSDSEGQVQQVGALVDSVREVCVIPTDNIQWSGEASGAVGSDSLIVGMGKVKNKVVMLLSASAVAIRNMDLAVAATDQGQPVQNIEKAKRLAA